MKIINKTSQRVIDVPNDHAQVLFGQGWMEYKEVKHEEKVEKQEEVLIPEFSKQRGRPKKH